MNSQGSVRLEIDLGAIEGNYRAIEGRIAGRAQIAAVVKANAYGHGLTEVAGRLVTAGASSLAVSNASEAEELRDSGLASIPIIVMGGSTEDELRLAARIGASPAIYGIDDLRALNREAARVGCSVGAQLKIDTGMSRLGVMPGPALTELMDEWRSCPGVRMEGVFTHFAAADTDPDFTMRQNEIFMESVRLIRSYRHSPAVHAAASSGIALGPAVWHDMVRAGIALYGGSVRDKFPELKPAQRLTARPTRIEWIQPGDTVGYGRTYTAEARTRVMTLPVGYGDGYKRILGNRAQALVRGTRVGVIGRVCMDQMALDVTRVEGVSMEDEVVLMGEQRGERITPDELAAWADTISYEIMLGFAQRAPKRVYIQ